MATSTYYSAFFPAPELTGAKGSTIAAITTDRVEKIDTSIVNIQENVQKLADGGYLDDTPPAAPTALLVTSDLTDAGATLRYSWTAPADTDIAGYDLQIKEASGSYISFSTAVTTYEIRAVPRNQLFTARVRAYDKAGNYGVYSNVVTYVTVRDSVPPATPVIIAVEAAYETVNIRWSNGNENDLDFATITLYGADNTPLDGKRVSASKGGGSLVWVGLAKATTYKAAVALTDTSGNTSPYTAMVSFTTAGGIDYNDFTPGLSPIKTVTLLPNPVGYSGPTIVFYAGKLYRYVNGVWTKEVDNSDLAQNSITTEKLVDSVITANKLGANFGGGNLVRNSSLDNGNYNFNGYQIANGFSPYDNALSGQTTNTDRASWSNNFPGRRGGFAQGIGWVTQNTTKGIILTDAGGVNNGNLTKPNSTYTLTFYAYGLGAATKAGMRLEWNNSPYVTNILNPILANKWQRYQFKLVTGETVDPNIFINTGYSGQESGSYWIDDIQLEEGDVATAYSPALLPGEIVSSLLADKAVVSTKIGDLAITETKIDNNAITTGKIKAGAITATQIAADTITADQIAANAITVNELAANAVTANKIAANTITTNHITARAITATEIASNAVMADKIAANSITADKIKANEITANKLTLASRPFSTIGLNFRVDEANTLTWDSGYVLYQNDSGTASSWYVNGGSFSGNAGTNYYILAEPQNNTIISTTNESLSHSSSIYIYLGTFLSGTKDWRQAAGVGTIINGDRIVTGSINANKITANTITANEIKSGTITAAQIAAGAISATKLLITDTTFLNPDSGFRDTSYWRNDGSGQDGPLGTNAGTTRGWYNIHAADIDGALGTNKYIMLWEAYKPSGRVHLRQTTRQTNLRAGKTYQLSATCRNASSQIIYVLVRTYNASNVSISNAILNWSPGEVGPKTIQFTAPPGIANWEFIIYNEANNDFAGNCQVYDVQVVEAAGATAIKDGAITTDKITVGTLSGDRITAGTLDAGALRAGSILAGTIQVSSGGTLTGLGTTATWGGVSGLGKPADNATVGAPTGTNVGNTEAQTVANNAATGAQDPATRINAAATQIGPGKISVGGGGTLRNWMQGDNSTEINGGAVAANTISANKLTIANRGLSFIGLNFEWNPVNGYVYWSEGYIYYIDDINIPRAEYISAGNSAGATPHRHFYWARGTGIIQMTQDYGTALTNNTVMIGSWWGGSNLNITYGGTIINGDRITTGTITANKLRVASLDALTGTIGLLRTASSGERMELASNSLSGFFSDNTIAFKLGIF